MRKMRGIRASLLVLSLALAMSVMPALPVQTQSQTQSQTPDALQDLPTLMQRIDAPDAQAAFEGGDLAGAEALLLARQSQSPSADRAQALGLIAHQQGRPTAAAALFAKAAALDPSYARSRFLVDFWIRIGQPQAAYEHGQLLLQQAQDSFGPQAPQLIKIRLELAALAMGQRDFTGAETLLRDAITLIQSTQGADHPDHALILAALADLLRAQGQAPQALALQRRALAITENALGRAAPPFIRQLNDLIRLLVETGAMSEAIGQGQKAAALGEAGLPYTQQGAPYIDYIHAFAQRNSQTRDLAQQLGRKNLETTTAQMLSLSEQMLAITEQTIGRAPPQYDQHLQNHAALLLLAHRFDALETLAAATLAQLDRQPGSALQSKTADWLLLQAQAIAGAGRWREAEAPLRRAFAIYRSSLGDAAAPVSETAGLLVQLLTYSQGSATEIAFFQAFLR